MQWGRRPSALRCIETLSFGRSTPEPGDLITIHNNGPATLSGTVTSPCESFTVVGPADYSLAPGDEEECPFDLHSDRFWTTKLPAEHRLAGQSESCARASVRRATSLRRRWTSGASGRTSIGRSPSPTPIRSRSRGTVASPCGVLVSIVGPRGYNLAPGASQTFTVHFQSLVNSTRVVRLRCWDQVVRIRTCHGRG